MSSLPPGMPPPNHPSQPPQQPKPFKVPIEAFKLNAETGVFSTTTPDGKVLSAKNPFALQAQYLLTFPPHMRADIGRQMAPISMQWSTCAGPSLQDVANDAVDEAGKKAYMEAANKICPVRETIPAARIDVMRTRCSTPRQACTFLISSAASHDKDPKNYVAKYGLAKTRYYNCETCRINEAGKEVIRKLSEEEQNNLKASLQIDKDDVTKMVHKMCSGGKSDANHNVTRVCVYNLRRAFENQSHSIIKTVDDAQKLKKDRMRILIFVACILGVILIIVIIIVVRHVSKKNKAAAKAEDLLKLGVMPNLPTLEPLAGRGGLEPLAGRGGLEPLAGRGGLEPLAGHHSTTHHTPQVIDPVDAEIQRLSVNLPK